MEEILIVDMQALLDESQVGRQAAVQLQEAWAAAEAEIEKAEAKAEQGAAKPDKRATRSGKGLAKPDKGSSKKKTAKRRQEEMDKLEAQRRSLRSLLLERAQPIIAQIAEARGASVVLEREAVILFKRSSDITAEVMTSVDAMGPLGEA